MADPPTPLPSFRRPPVVETVIGLHFEPLPRFDVAQRSLFWSAIRTEFPNLEERPPVDEVREDFGDVTKRVLGIRWKVAEAPIPVRLWAKSGDGRHTIQIQRDALIVNWERDPGSPDQYWPYEGRRDDFVGKFTALAEFLEKNQLGEIKPTSCWVKYINHIEYGEMTIDHLARSVLSVWNGDTSDGWLPEMEHCDFDMAYRMPDNAGRLHVKLSPAVRRADGHQVLRMELTARGTPRDTSVGATLNWLDQGHEWIVRGFTSLTRAEKHEQWERTR